MGRGTNKDGQIDTKGLKQILGRIFRPRHADTGDLPFLLVKERTVRVELASVIAAITQNPGRNDHDIVGMVNVAGVKPADIEIIRAYIHRFGTDLANPLPLAAHAERLLLLDENTPQPAMLHLSQNFGWATHVSAEGFAGRDTPDQDIWGYAHAQRFSAILTRDTDFLYIQREFSRAAFDQGAADVPLLIFVPEAVSTESLTGLFSTYAENIRHYMAEKTHLACSLGSKNGCQPLAL